MGSRLIYELATHLGEAGYYVTRFNYRGVGRSAGVYGQGAGEAADAKVVFEQIAAQTGKSPAVVGFSFGGCVAVELAAQGLPAATVLVACPATVRNSLLQPVEAAAKARGPAHALIGDCDELVSVQDARLVAEAWPGCSFEVLPGADHFLTPTHHDAAVARVAAALQALL